MRHLLRIAAAMIVLAFASTMSAKPADALCDDDCPFDHAAIWKNCELELDGGTCSYFDSHYYFTSGGCF